MGPLARAIYRILRRRVPRAAGQEFITYEILCAQLRQQYPSRFGRIHLRFRRLHIALGEIVLACHAARLTILAALVVRFDWSIPGMEYYGIASPHVDLEDWPAMLSQWASEAMRARATKYP